MTAIGRYSDLAGRVALVTGASSGIGLGIAESLLEQGMRVGVHYRSGQSAAESLCARFGDRAVALKADLSTESGCVGLVSALSQAFGEAHLLVHSAGIWNGAPIEAMKRETLEEMFQVNVWSAFYLVRELTPLFRAAGRGNIIFIGSTAGERGEAGHSHYAASKGALQSLAMSLAVELAPLIRTNLISPGWVRTPMAESTLAAIEPIIVPTLPNRRIAEIADVSEAVAWLASDASGHVLGQVLSISGGALLVVPRGQFQSRS